MRESGQSTKRCSPWAVPVALFLFALGWRLLLLARQPWDGLYGQDPFAYWWQAQAIAARLPQGLFPPLDFFWPSGYPATVAPLLWLFGARPQLALSVSAVAGALLPALHYLVARELLAPRSAWPIAGALLLAVSGQPLLTSLTVMSDVPALTWAMLGLWLALRGQRARHGSRWWLAAGVALAMAVVSRWLLALVPAALLLALLAQRTAWPHARQGAALGLGMALPLLPQLWLSSHRPDSLAHHILLGWQPVHAFQRTFVTAEGVQQFRWPPALFNLFPAIHPAFLAPPLGLLALLGLWALWRRRAWRALALVGGWGLGGYLLLAGLPYENIRYGILLIVPVLLLLDAGTDWLWQRAVPLRRGLLIGFVALALLTALWGVRMTTAFIDLHNASKGWVADAARQMPPDSTLIAFGMSQIAEEYTPFEVHNLYTEDAQTITALRATAHPLFLLIDVPALTGQWAGLPPEQLYRVLVAQEALIVRDQIGPLTLFEFR